MVRWYTVLAALRNAVLYSTGLVLTSLFAVILLWRQPFVLTGVLAVLSLGTLQVHRSREAVIVYLLAGVGGAVSEIIAVSMGVWQYATPQFFGIPVWLPLLWGLAALYITELRKEVAAVYAVYT